MENVKCEVEIISPSIASFYINKKALLKNRTIYDNRVRTYVKLMENGEWYLGDTLLFDVDDNLINGHHRLHAVIRYGKPVKFLVARNVDGEYIKHIDSGKSRTGSEVLMMEGVKNPNIVSKGLKIAKGIKNNSKYITRFSVSNAEIISAYHEESDYINSLSNVAKAMENNLGSKSISASYILGYLLSKNNDELREKALKFFELLCSDTIENRAYILTKFREDLLRGTRFSNLSKNNEIHLMVEKLFNVFIVSEEKLKSIRNYPNLKSND